MLRRSLLFIPGNNPAMLQNAEVFGRRTRGRVEGRYPPHPSHRYPSERDVSAGQEGLQPGAPV